MSNLGKIECDFCGGFLKWCHVSENQALTVKKVWEILSRFETMAVTISNNSNNIPEHFCIPKTWFLIILSSLRSILVIFRKWYICLPKDSSRHEWGRKKFGGWDGVKFRIFTFTYNTQFLLYDNVVNIFLFCFELKKHLRTLSEHSEKILRFLVDVKLLHGVKQGFSSNSYIFRSWR